MLAHIQVSHLLTVLNSSINFYIYLAKQGVAELRLLRLNIRDPEETEMVRCCVTQDYYEGSAVFQM